MTTQLCACCRHRFPPSSLVKSSFSDEVGEHLAAVQAILASMEPTLANRDVRQRLEVVLQGLVASVHGEVDTLKRRLTLAEEQRSSRERDLEAANAKAAALAAEREGTGSHTGYRFAPPQVPRQAPLPTFNGTLTGRQQRKMTTAFELVSASVYNVLESLAVEVRADTALLWIRLRGAVAVELVAPFVAGRPLPMLRTSAPYRVQETSMPAAVATTGTAINLRPLVGVHDPRPSEEIELNELMERSNVAQLLVPVYHRYGGPGSSARGAASDPADNGVMAVVHLIGSPRGPFPFSSRNEESVALASALLSWIMSSHYDVLASEWGNHFYDPTTLHSTSTFQGRLDLRADEKAVDDFTPSPLLILRCERQPNDPSDPREAYAALRSAMARSAVPAQPPVLARVRDLHRHAAAMEENWAEAVDATTRLEHRLCALDEDMLHTTVQRLREAREAAGGREPHAPPTSKAPPPKTAAEPPAAAEAEKGKAAAFGGAAAATATAAPAEASGGAGASTEAAASPNKVHGDSPMSVDGNVRLTPASRRAHNNGGKSEPTLNPEEVSHLESVVLRRLERLGVDTAAFHSLTPSGA